MLSRIISTNISERPSSVAGDEGRQDEDPTLTSHNPERYYSTDTDRYGEWK